MCTLALAGTTARQRQRRITTTVARGLGSNGDDYRAIAAGRARG